MEMKLTGLKTVLKKFDKTWKGAYTFGSWKIANGGYDCWFELYYKNQPVVQCIAGEVSCITSLFNEPDKEKLLNKILEVFDHPHLFLREENNAIEPEIDNLSFEPDDVDEKKSPAATLPEGWEWVDYDDGSGSLRAPDGKHYFSYDLHTSYTPMGGIEYMETNDWTAFYGSLSDFKMHAENVVSEKYLDLNKIEDLISQANAISEQAQQLSHNLQKHKESLGLEH